MTDRLAAIVGRLEAVSSAAARGIRLASIVGASAAVVCWWVLFPGLTAFRLGGVAVLLVPAGYLWWYAGALDRAVDLTDLRAATGGLVERVTAQAAEVRSSLAASRFRLIRSAWAAVRATQELRGEIERLGLDWGRWALLSNPMVAACAGLSLIAAVFLAIAAGIASFFSVIF